MNASFEPLNVINWRRAVKLVFLEKVEVIEHGEHEVHSERTALRVPAVVRLLRYVRFGRREVKFSRQNIYARDGFQCQYCGIKLPPKDLTCDHVVPRSRGGQTVWSNIVSCCRSCNRKKGGRTPVEAGLSLLKKPRRPSWLFGFHARFVLQTPPPAWREYLFLSDKEKTSG